MKIPIEIKINEVRAGHEYDGECKIGERLFTFRIGFSMGIKKFCELTSDEIPTDDEGRQKFIPIKVAADGKPVTINKEAYGLFVALIVGPAVELFNSPQSPRSDSKKQDLDISEEGDLAVLRSIGCKV